VAKVKVHHHRIFLSDPLPPPPPANPDANDPYDDIRSSELLNSPSNSYVTYPRSINPIPIYILHKSNSNGPLEDAAISSDNPSPTNTLPENVNPTASDDSNNEGSTLPQSKGPIIHTSIGEIQPLSNVEKGLTNTINPDIDITDPSLSPDLPPCCNVCTIGPDPPTGCCHYCTRVDEGTAKIFSNMPKDPPAPYPFPPPPDSSTGS